MATIEFNGKSFEIDEDGFLLDYNTYCDEWVDYVKTQEGIGRFFLGGGSGTG